MPSELVLNALRSMEFTQDLEPKQLEKLASIATYVTFSEGATIFREGDGDYSDRRTWANPGLVILISTAKKDCRSTN